MKSHSLEIKLFSLSLHAVLVGGCVTSCTAAVNWHHVGAQSRYKIRVVSARAYHCLFMHNMLIRPTERELASFGRPDFTIFNAGAFPCNRYTSYMTSSSSVDINLKVPPSHAVAACARRTLSGSNCPSCSEGQVTNTHCMLGRPRQLIQLCRVTIARAASMM